MSEVPGYGTFGFSHGRTDGLSVFSPAALHTTHEATHTYVSYGRMEGILYFQIQPSDVASGHYDNYYLVLANSRCGTLHGHTITTRSTDDEIPSGGLY
jgi:hypothetical protein